MVAAEISEVAAPIHAAECLRIFKLSDEAWEIRDLQNKIVAGPVESLNLAYVLVGMIEVEILDEYPMHPDAVIPEQF